MWLIGTFFHGKSVVEKDKMIKAKCKHTDKRYFKGKYEASNRWVKAASKNFTEAKNEVLARGMMTEDKRRRHTLQPKHTEMLKFLGFFNDVHL